MQGRYPTELEKQLKMHYLENLVIGKSIFENQIYQIKNGLLIY
jgi:hypothetical protein